jgi:P pilus assembly chaperone PapD
MRTRTLFSTLIIALAMVSRVEADVFAQVAPVKYNLTMRPGEPLLRDVLISNQGDQPVVVRVRLSDWDMSSQGSIVLLPAGSTEHSLKGRVQFEPNQFSLQPGESGRVHVTMTMLDDGPATRWGVLLSEVRPAVFKKQGFGPRAIAELGTTIYLSRVKPGVVETEVTDLSVTPLASDSVAVTVRVRNAGERHFYVAGEMALFDSLGNRFQTGNLGTGVVLPGREREFTWTCATEMLPGSYLASAVLDTGEPELVVGETWFRWPARWETAPNFARRASDTPSSSP